MQELIDNFGVTITLLREKRNLTQKIAAKSIGVATETLGRWEGSKTTPNIAHLVGISETYEIDSINELFKEPVK